MPSRSLALIEATAPAKDAPILDVGGGASRLTDQLLARGYLDLSVLDISQVALKCAQARLGNRASQVSWITADVTEWNPVRRWQIWHDRALFHFLTEEPQWQAYLEALEQATVPGATVIIAGFSPHGPERCSGLKVRRYGRESLTECLGENFILARSAMETHRTPSGASQDFLYACFRRQS